MSLEMKSLVIDNNEYEIVDEKARLVNSIAEMKSIEGLQVGNIISTIGYYEANDGGAATYKIREKQETDIEDLGSIHFINDNLVAELIIKDNEVNPIQFGAKCDGITDDSVCIRNAINYLSKQGGGNLNLLNNKTYILSTIENGCFIMLKDNCNIYGNSTLKIKDNLGDWNFMFRLGSDINNLVLKDFTIDENSINNAPTENTGTEGNKRTIFRMIATDYKIENMLFENIKTNDCLGVWQYEFESQCNHVKMDRCIINYNKTYSVEYDRTSIYFGVNNGSITNCVLNGSDNARTGIEVHGHNNIVKDNIITNYKSGIYICNDRTVPYNTENKMLDVSNNKIEVKYRGIMLWMTFNDMTTENIQVHSNYIKMLPFDYTNEIVAIGTYDTLGTNTKIKNLKIYDNTIISENEKANGFRFYSTKSGIDTSFDNFEIFNNTIKGVYGYLFRFGIQTDDSFKITNLLIKNNNFIVDNDITACFHMTFRNGIKNIHIKDNNFIFNGIPTTLFKLVGNSNSDIFKISNNKTNYDFNPLYLCNGNGTIYVVVEHEFENLILTDVNTSNYLKQANTGADNGSILKDKNWCFKKVNGTWFTEYIGEKFPTHIPVYKGGIFRLSNDDFIIRHCLRDGFVADHVAGTNLIGEWIHAEGDTQVFQCKTNNEITTPTQDDTTNFKYIGRLSKYNDITV